MEKSKCIYSLSKDIVLRGNEQTSKFWALNTNNGDHYNLNTTAYWLLERFSSKGALEDVLSDFLDTFEVDGEQGESDFMSIVDLFLKEQIIIEEENKE